MVVPAAVQQAKTKAMTPTDATRGDAASLLTVDDLVRSRARSLGDQVVVSYPSSGIDYVDYSMRQLDLFAYRVARYYEAQLPVRTSSSSSEKPAVVAMLGPSSLEYLVTMLALIKLGHTILFLSTRISHEAVASLLQTTHARAILADPRHAQTAERAATLLGGDNSTYTTLTTSLLLPIANRTAFEYSIDDVPADFDTRLDGALDHTIETDSPVYIVHSSGSTGLPKPIYQTHRTAMVNYSTHMDMRAFITLPLYHNHGICNFFRAVHSGRSIHMYNADLPLVAGHLEAILAQHHFEIFYGVPYALKLLAETATGVELLRRLRVVMYGGSACPDELGNILVDAGVNLIGHYGATEVGQLMTSFRPAGDLAWNYVRETDRLSPFLQWIPRGPNLFECCVRDGWPAKLTSNQPDGAYATKDLFEPHPTIPRAWKYVARLDDTIALLNGEKFSPVPLEGRIRSDSWVAEAVVFGSGRPCIGLLLVPARDLPRDAVLDHIWPIVDSANARSEAYGRLARSMIVVLPHDAPVPRTDKGSIIRQGFYRTFAREIDAAYDEADQALSSSAAGSGVMTLDEIQDFLRLAISALLLENQRVNVDDSTDFFSLGMDSLQAIQLRQDVLRNIDLGGRRLGSNVVFDYPSVARLAAYLHSLWTGSSDESVSVEAEMNMLVDKYSILTDVPQRLRTTVVITGATGSLGAHVVARLSADPSIQQICCLVRAKDDEQATQRLRNSLADRRVLHSMTLSRRQKLRALCSDQSDRLLGLSEDVYWEVATGLRAVIHCAWSVNFNLRLSSFEKDCLAGVKNLLKLCLAAADANGPPPSFSFCSSVSTTARFPSGNSHHDSYVPESLSDFAWAQGMGYAQSKAVAEHLCERAAKTHGIPTRVLRVGQIIADSRFGIWNATEAIPLMLQTALTVGALPRLREQHAWLPVDTVAQAVLDIALAGGTDADLESPFIIANVVNSCRFGWTTDLLPALHAAGLAFEEVEPREWVRRLRASDPDPAANPPIKLVNFFASKYDRNDFGPSKTYATETGRRLSPTLAAAPVVDQASIYTFVQRFLANAWRRTGTSSKTKTKTKTKTKLAVVLSGPCGSGKTIVGQCLASALEGAAFIEGDSLHTREAVSRMAAGSALVDVDRWDWLARIRRHVRQTAYGLGYDVVVVSCSALRRTYRDALRKLGQSEDECEDRDDHQTLNVLFLDLQAPAAVLRERVAQRQGHYITTNMVGDQVREHEPIAADEEDVMPIDAAGKAEDVLDLARWAVSRVM